jgi:hypothetical protein
MARTEAFVFFQPLQPAAPSLLPTSRDRPAQIFCGVINSRRRRLAHHLVMGFCVVMYPHQLSNLHG